MAQGFFITATGTGIGKTLITAGLVWQLRHRGYRVRALKPVISGFNPEFLEDSDTGILLRALEQSSPEDLEAMSPWRFSAPLSPDMAARREGRTLELDEITAFCKQALNGAEDYVLIEGVGGVMVPLAHRARVTEWMAGLAIPTVLVAGSYLGTLSHTLTALEALERRSIPVAALIISESCESPVPLEETAESLKSYYNGLMCLIPRVMGEEPWRHLPNLTAIVEGS